MALVVRNTFLDFTQEEDADCLQQTRCSSAPPTCRHKGDYSSDEAVSVTCETYVDSNSSTEHSTEASDIDDFASGSSNYGNDNEDSDSDHEYEDVSPAMSDGCCDSDDDEICREGPAPAPTLSEAAAQEQLDQMSQMVMDIWSQLRSVESTIEAHCADAVEAPAPAPAPTVVEATPSVAPTSTKLDGKACAFQPGCSGASDVQIVLSSVRQAVMMTAGVADVDVNHGPAGTLATISIRLQFGTQPLHVQSVLASTKSALLQAAETSQSTYVLGYETQDPFQDDRTGSGFTAALATMPSAWKSCACWDTYTSGSCSRRKNCTWKHPGRNELQPVRVVVC